MSTVFVTGATGVIGRATIPHLVAAGHAVRALSRSEANDETIRALGAEPVRGDLFDLDSLATAMRGSDAVFHLATRIPASSEMRRREAWRENDRVRAEGTRVLVDAALASNIRTLVYPSFAAVYPDSGDAWIDAAATQAEPLDILQSTVTAEREVARFAAAGGRRGVALRLGLLYGSDLPSTAEQLRLAAKGISPIGGSGEAYAPTLWIDDAATAIVAALERAPSGLYDVVDDEPLQRRAFTTALAAAVGRGRLVSPPAWLLRLLAGPAAGALSSSLRISNRRFREATGWAPAVPNAHVGLARIAAERSLPTKVYVPAAVRAGLWIMLLFALFAGFQQQFMPRAFYDRFPGFGWQWVSVDGPYNEHLLRDLGGANLALAVVILFAIVRPSPGLVQTVAAALLVSQVPHFIYHAAHLDLMPTLLDKVLQTGSLALTVLTPLAVLVEARKIAPGRAALPSPSTTVGTADAPLRQRLIAAAR